MHAPHCSRRWCTVDLARPSVRDGEIFCGKVQGSGQADSALNERPEIPAGFESNALAGSHSQR